jgi:hypothetical protein
MLGAEETRSGCSARSRGFAACHTTTVCLLILESVMLYALLVYRRSMHLRLCSKDALYIKCAIATHKSACMRVGGRGVLGTGCQRCCVMGALNARWRFDLELT